MKLFKENPIGIYINSLLLHNSQWVEDFLILRNNVKEGKREELWEYGIKRSTVALLRFALRECEEVWMENNITL